jgi:hypothetical protein
LETGVVLDKVDVDQSLMAFSTLNTLFLADKFVLDFQADILLVAWDEEVVRSITKHILPATKWADRS